MEVDLLFPDDRLAIEFNGVWWHSEDNVGRDRHLLKRRRLEEQGFELVTVWSDVWQQRRDAVLRMLASRLGVVDSLLPRYHARSLRFVCVSGRDASSFMEANHIQGAVSATRHFGLADGCGTLLAVMSVRRERPSGRLSKGEGTWTIVRYATSAHVVGGFSRILAHAEKALLGEGECLRTWLTFSDCDLSSGAMYASCGFSHDGEVAPDYRYAGSFTGWRRVPKESFQKSRFRDDDNLVWDESWTESQAARQNGLYRCYDSGKIRWIRHVG